MNHTPFIFLGLLFTMVSSFLGLVFAPNLQLGGLQQVAVVGSGDLYPAVSRPGTASQGAEIYRSFGCVQCHSQQVRQMGAEFDVQLGEPGTNSTSVARRLTRSNTKIAAKAAAEIVASARDDSMKTVLAGVSPKAAQAVKD